jgi:RHS repeat-associated protein
LDRFDRVMDQNWSTDGGTPLVRQQHKYDRGGRQIYSDDLVLTSGKDEFYNYDGLDQLIKYRQGNLNFGKTGIDGTPKGENQYGLDPLGNWPQFQQWKDGAQTLNQSRTHNKANEVLTASALYTPVHDAAGNMTAMPRPNDPAKGFKLTWDAWNRLVKVVAADTNKTVVEYQYDALHRRIVKLTPNPVTPANWDRSDFYENGAWQEIEERFAANLTSKTAVAALPRCQYIYDLRYIDAVAVRDRDADGNTANGMEEHLFYCHNSIFSVNAVVSKNAALLERAGYDPYGKVLLLDPSGQPKGNTALSEFGNSIWFTGRELEIETGLYQSRARNLSPELGRFISRDPLRGQGFLKAMDELQLYGYANSNPFLFADPSGGCPGQPSSSNLNAQRIPRNQNLQGADFNVDINFTYNGTNRLYKMTATYTPLPTCQCSSVKWYQSKKRTENGIPIRSGWDLNPWGAPLSENPNGWATDNGGPSDSRSYEDSGNAEQTKKGISVFSDSPTISCNQTWEGKVMLCCTSGKSAGKWLFFAHWSGKWPGDINTRLNSSRVSSGLSLPTDAEFRAGMTAGVFNPNDTGGCPLN